MNHFSDIADNLKDIIFHYQVQPDNRFTYINQAVFDILGITSAEILNTEDILGKLIHPDDTSKLAEFVNNIETSIDTIELRVKTKENSIKWVEVNISPVFDNSMSITALNGIARDITLTKKYNEKEQHTKNVLLATKNIDQLIKNETQPEIIVKGSCDILTETTGYINAWIILLNQDGNVEFTYSSAISNGFDRLTSQLDIDGFPACMKKAIDSNQVITVSKHSSDCESCPLKEQFQEYAGMCTPIKYRDTLYGFLSVSIPPEYISNKEEHEMLTDISQNLGFTLDKLAIEKERLRLQKEVKSRQDKLEQIFNIMPIGVWFADENGKLVMGNPAGIEIWGAEPKVGPKKYDVFKARRLPSREIIQPDDWALAHTINKGIAITNELLEIEAFDGKNKIILNHTFPVFDNEDNVEGAIVINQDITTEKMKELRLSKVNKCLLNLGSDFNENINSITSLAGKLLDGAAAFYNKFDDTRDLLISKSQWNAPPDFKKEDSPYGHVCYETIISGPEVQYIPDLLKTKYATSDPNVQKYDLRSYLGHLVKAEDEVFGILCVVFTEETIVSEDDEKLIGILASAIAAEEERLSYTNKLKLSEERFRNVVESISDGIIELDLVNNKAYFSDRYYQMLGYEPNEFEPSYQAWMKAINPRDIDRVEKRFKEYISGKRGDFNVEYRAVHKSGELVWVQLKGKVEEYSDIGEPLKFIATQIDMTEHKKLEEMKKNRLIVQEVHHRVKNNLQVISSLLNMESRKLENEHIKHVFQDSQNRIRSMALAHEKLYGADNLASVEISDYIQSLSSYLIQSHNRNHIKIKLNIDSDTIYASMDIVVPLGLILNEIITNSLKHAFYNMEEGTINISFYQIDDKYHLEIEDNGIGISHDFDLESSNSLGVKIIDMLVAQLGGDIDMERSGGVKYHLTFNCNQ